MPRSRKGFTVIELALVVTLMGIVTAMSIPRITKLRAGASMRAAKQELAVALGRARSLAVQQGRPVRLIRAGSAIRVASANGGVEVTLVPARDLQDVHLVTLDGAAEVGFDARGFASGIAGLAVIRLQQGELRDSVCVARTGKILSTACLP